MPSPPGAAYRLSIDEMKMMDPPVPRSRIARAAAWAPKTWAVRFRRTMASHPASVTSSHSVVLPGSSVKPPALLTQTSIRPSPATAASASARIWATSLTSVGWTTARRPLASTSRATVARSPRLRAPSTSSAPRSAKASAIARPSPRLAPVTTQTLPASENAGPGSGPCMVHRLPDALGPQRHVDVADLERVERVDHRVHHRRRRADGRRLADALGAERVDRSRRDRLVGDERREVVGPRHAVVHERAGHQLAVRAVDHFLQERLCDALGQPPVHLARDEGRADADAAVIDRHELAHRDLAGLAIDLDDRDVRPEGIQKLWRPEEVGCLEP